MQGARLREAVPLLLRQGMLRGKEKGPWCEAVWTGRKGSGMKLLVLR